MPSAVCGDDHQCAPNRLPSVAIVGSFAFLVVVATSKTVLSKYVFERLRAPVAMSALSCVVTTGLLMPVAACGRHWHAPRRGDLSSLLMVCMAVAADLALTNVGLSILPLAFQQSIKSTLPMATVVVEFLVGGTRASRQVLVIVTGTCLGPMIMALDKDWEADDDLWYGVVMLVLSVLAGALKYVLTHAAMQRCKAEMGILGFTLWMEIVVALLLLPWAVANGELSAVLEASSDWALLTFTSAFGGVRIMAQFYFLSETSPTSLATSNVAIQVGLTVAGALIFHDPVTLCMALGSAITLLMSSSFAYLKLRGSRAATPLPQAECVPMVPVSPHRAIPPETIARSPRKRVTRW